MNKFEMVVLPMRDAINLWDTVVWPLLAPAVALSNGESTEASLKQRVKIEEVSVVLAIFGGDPKLAFTLEVTEYDSGLRVLSLPYISGNGIAELLADCFEELKQIARQSSCTEIRGMSVRRGWMKVLKPLGWEPVHEVIKCNVGDPT